MWVTDPRTGRTRVTKRLKRYDQPGQAHFLTFCCFQRYRFFEGDLPRQWFLEALQRARERWCFRLWAYVLMPEHVHLLIDPNNDSGEISHLLRNIKEPVGRQAIAYLRQHNARWLEKVTVYEGKRTRHRFWQAGGGHDANITDLHEVRAIIEYIHANPVRRGLVEQATDWEWSSARWYAGITPVALELDPLPTA